jgi:hypothetical protein
MFGEVPPADAYTLKLILHDWSDEECVRILANKRRAVFGEAACSLPSMSCLGV